MAAVFSGAGLFALGALAEADGLLSGFDDDDVLPVSLPSVLADALDLLEIRSLTMFI